MAFLEVRELSKQFGGLIVLKDVNFDINAGEILGLIGPNGAGKSTLYNVIVGVHKPTSGSIVFEGKDITSLRPSQAARKGIIKTFQANVSFRDFTVTENIIVGHHLQVEAGLLGTFFNSFSARKDSEDIRNNIPKILEFFNLTQRQHELAGRLPHGFQRLLGIATAVVAGPRLLLLDEPVTGMNDEESKFTVELIRKLRDTGITIMLVEHDMKVVMNLCDRVMVLNFGKMIAGGTPKEIMKNEDVIEAYLGVD